MIGVWLLTNKNKPFLIDRKDYAVVVKINWFYNISQPETKNNKEYGVFTGNVNGKMVKLHRFLLEPKQNEIVDHINRDTSDNRRENLRIVSYKESARNRSRQKTRKSPHFGVWWRKDRNKWVGEIKVNNKRKQIGHFNTEEEAAKAVAEAYSACIRN